MKAFSGHRGRRAAPLPSRSPAIAKSRTLDLQALLDGLSCIPNFSLVLVGKPFQSKRVGQSPIVLLLLRDFDDLIKLLQRAGIVLAALNAHADLLPESKSAAEIAASVFDRWSDSLRQKGDWQGAVDIYDRGLQLYPKDRHLENNAVATWDRWSRTYMDRKDWKGAIGIYEKALERFPNNGTLTHNLKYCREQMQKGG